MLAAIVVHANVAGLAVRPESVDSFNGSLARFVGIVCVPIDGTVTLSGDTLDGDGGDMLREHGDGGFVSSTVSLDLRAVAPKQAHASGPPAERGSWGNDRGAGDDGGELPRSSHRTDPADVRADCSTNRVEHVTERCTGWSQRAGHRVKGAHGNRGVDPHDFTVGSGSLQPTSHSRGRNVDAFSDSPVSEPRHCCEQGGCPNVSVRAAEGWSCSIRLVLTDIPGADCVLLFDGGLHALVDAAAWRGDVLGEIEAPSEILQGLLDGAFRLVDVLANGGRFNLEPHVASFAVGFLRLASAT